MVCYFLPYSRFLFPYSNWRIKLTSYTRYPYPIFEQLPLEGRIGLFGLSAVVMALSTATLKWLHGRVNGFGTSVKAQARPGAVKMNGGL
jgi:hypothetical protein